MVVATKSVDSLLRGIVSPDKLMISRLDSISKAIQLDPNISEPKKEMFVVSTDDVKNIKVRKEFMDSVESKHPECLVMFVSKNGRVTPDIDTNLFDSFLSKPKKDDIRNAFIQLIEASEQRAQASSTTSVDTPEEYSEEAPAAVETKPEYNDGWDDTPAVSLKVEEAPAPKAPVKESTDIDLVDRIRRTESWAGITSVVSEVNAANILREVSEANMTFKQSEAHIAALQENINAIMCNPEYDTSTRLSKVHSILCDKAYIKSKTNSIIEQNVEAIINVIVEKAKEVVEAKTQEMDEKIINALKYHQSEEAPNVRLATIIENRAKVLLDLQTLDLELKGIASRCTDTINDTVSDIISESTTSTGSPILDSKMKSRFGDIAPDNLLVVLDNLFMSGKNVSDEFGDMSAAVNSTIRKLYALLSYYKEETEVLGETIRFMKANNVEDTVVANTIMKKSSRLYIHNGDFDSTAITYMISKYQSRKNDNVLLLDLTGSPVFDMFGVKTTAYSSMMNMEHFQNKFLVVSTYDDTGISVSTEDDMQRLSARLLHYAKHYSKINIMCTSDQKHVIDSFKSDVISITYMVDCYPTTIKTMSKCIEDSHMDNTATRVVLVNCVSDSSRVCNDLGIMERFDIQLSTCRPVPEIRYCSLHKQDPFDVDSIVDDIGGVLRTC